MDKSIVTKCVDKKKTYDVWESLPRGISHQVLLNLTPDVIANLTKCCNKWHLGLDCDFTWKSLYRKFYGDSKEPNSTAFETKFRSKVLYWRGRFLYNEGLEFNVQHNIFKTVPVPLETRSEIQIDCVYLDERTLILIVWRSCEIPKLLIINSSTGLIEHDLPCLGLHKAIKHLDFVIVVTLYCHLLIWHIESGICITNARWDRATGIPCTLQACKLLILIETEKGSVITFNIETNQFNDLGKSLRICCSSDTIATATKRYNDIQIADSNLKTLMQFTGSEISFLSKMAVTRAVFVQFFRNPRFLILDVWNIKTQPATQFQLKNVYDFSLIPNKDLILLTYQNANCEVWNLIDQICLFKIIIDPDMYISMKEFNEQYIFMVVGEGYIKIWCLKTGKFVQDLLLPNKVDFRIYLSNTKLLCCYIKEDKSRNNWNIIDFEPKMIRSTPQ